MSDKTNIPCEVVEDLLPSYADGLTNGRTNGLIEAHLRDCVPCREKYKAMCSPGAEELSEALPDGDGAEIDFLKRNRKRNRRITLFSVLGALLVAAGVLFVKLFVVGSDGAGNVLCRIQVIGNELTVSAKAGDNRYAVRGLRFEEHDGVIDVIPQTVLKSLLCAEELTERYEAESCIEKVKLNGSTIYESVRQEMKLSDEIGRRIKENWQEYNALSPFDKQASSGVPGYVTGSYDTWDEAVEALGFRPLNPFEGDEAYENRNYAGADVPSYPDGRLKHAMMECSGNEDGTPTQVRLSAGYALSGVRVVYTVTPELTYYDEVTGNYFYSGASINLGTAADGEMKGLTFKSEAVSDGKWLTTRTFSTEKSEVTCFDYTLSNVQYTVRIVKVDGESDKQVYDEAVMRISDMLRNILLSYGKQVYNRAEGNMDFSDEMKQKAIDTWTGYDSLTDAQKMFLETIPGFCYEEFTTWEDAVRFIGFEPVNPFEYEPDFVKMNMSATDIKNPFDNELKHAALDWHGERDGGVTFAILNAGYRLGTVRLIYTAELAENHGADGSGPFYGDPDRETEMIEISNGVFVSAELETGESYGAAEIRFTAGGTPVSVRIINNSGEAGRAAFESAVERVTEIAKRTVE